MSRRHPLLPHLRRLGLRRLCHRRVQPTRRRLELSTSLRTDLALDALEMGPWTRQREDRGPHGLIQHSDKGVQYLALRYTQRLADAGAVASVGSTGDSCDKHSPKRSTRCSRRADPQQGPWKTIDDLEIAVAEYIDWFNHRRLHGEIGLMPPAEYETEQYRHHHAPAAADASVPSLH